MTQEACRSCGAPIFFVTTTKGHKMPIDRASVPDGNVWVDPDTKIAHVGNPPAGALRFVSHFATCPNAKRHRRGGKRDR